MIEEPKLMRIARDMKRPTKAQIAAFQGVPTGFVVDAMFADGSLGTVISPLADHETHVAGPALTAHNRAADVLAALVALKFVRDGDVMISAAEGHQGCAAAGDRVLGMMKNAGAIGFVTDGPVRDFAGIKSVGLPCWCTGLNPGTPHTKGPGTVGLPVQMGGQRIETGDMIVADRDGVVVVPFARIDAVIAQLDDVAKAEHALDAEVAAGLVVPQSIDDLLNGDDVEYV